MTLRTNLTSAWSADIVTTKDTPVQVRRGIVIVNWAAVAPGSTRDGLLMGSGDQIIIPAGNTFRLAVPDTGDAHEVFYESFPV